MSSSHRRHRRTSPKNEKKHLRTANTVDGPSATKELASVALQLDAAVEYESYESSSTEEEEEDEDDEVESGGRGSSPMNMNQNMNMNLHAESQTDPDAESDEDGVEKNFFRKRDKQGKLKRSYKKRQRALKLKAQAASGNDAEPLQRLHGYDESFDVEDDAEGEELFYAGKYGYYESGEAKRTPRGSRGYYESGYQGKIHEPSARPTL